MGPQIYAVATMDTKGEEISYIAQRIRTTGCRVVTVDVGTGNDPVVCPDIKRIEVASCHPIGKDSVLSINDRGKAVNEMSKSFEQYILREFNKGNVLGVIGIGGSGGTLLISQGLKSLPIGVPKVLVSTMASGNIKPYIGSSDINMVFSVVDVAGINRVSKIVLGNAAHAIIGMIQNPISVSLDKEAIGMTMFGVTTPCVNNVRKKLEKSGFDCLVFHAVGTGGQAMEKLVESDMIIGVLDITTTEVCDEVVGGILTAGPKRFDIVFKKKIPYVMSVGALDMVNFGSKDTVPAKFKNRNLYAHNPQVTLMRTTPEENKKIAQWMVKKINRSETPFTLLIPEKGVSMLDAPGQPFYDPKADTVLFNELENNIKQTKRRKIKKYPYHINDQKFSEALVEEFLNVKNTCV